MVYNQNFFVFHPILMKHGEVVVPISVFIWLTKPVWLTGFLKKNGFGYLKLNNRLTGFTIFFNNLKQKSRDFPILGRVFHK